MIMEQDLYQRMTLASESWSQRHPLKFYLEKGRATIVPVQLQAKTNLGEGAW